MLLSQKQTEYVNEARHRWNFKGGATRSGKTYLDFRWVIPMRIRERVGMDGLAVILGVTKSTIERNVLEPMRGIYGDALVGTISSDNTARLFGERCYCLGAEKVSQVSKIRGASIKYCYGDEAADWSEEVFELLKSRLDKEYSCFDGTFNPQYPGHWLKRFLDSDADIFSQTYTIDDNPFLPPSFVENLKKEYAGTVFYDRYILGLWAQAEGLVYPMFGDGCVVDEHGFAGEWYLSMDYGTMNPTAMELWRIENGAATMEREYYYDGRSMRHQKTDEEYYQDMAAFIGQTPVRRIIIDPSAASFKATIRRHKQYHVMDADNAVLDGIRLTGTLLAGGKVKIHSSCQNAIREFGTYRWDEKRTEDAVIKDNDHCLTGDTLIDTTRGQRRIDELIGKSGKVYCTDGQRRKVGKFHDVRMTNSDAEIYEVTLKNGTTVKATADHPFLTKRGWVNLINLRMDDKILCIGGMGDACRIRKRWKNCHIRRN